jgi:hypothetical protein
MARPTTNTVPYFSHDSDASEKKTLTIIKGIYGLEGIGFWWTLLEWLARTENHYLNLSSDSDLEFLLQKLGLSLQLGTEIINKLSSLGAIDSILWEHKVVWCQNLVNRLDLVYKKRGRKLPVAPNFCDSNCNHTIVNNDISVTETGISDTVMLQSKVKYSKEKNIKKNNNCDKEQKNKDEDMDNHFKKFVEVYESKFGTIMNSSDAGLLQELSDEFPVKWFEEAMDEVVEKGIKNLKYVSKILYGKVDKNNKNNGHKQFEKPPEKPQPPIENVGESEAFKKYLEKQKQLGK